MNILNSLGYKVSEKSIRDGLKTVVHPGRFEILNKKPLIIFDGAHNEASITNLRETINTYYKNRKKTYIVSILKTKDFKEILRLLLEDENSNFIFTSGNDSTRYNTADDLYNFALQINKNQSINKMELHEAIDFILKEKNSENINFITGSFYIYGDVINKIKNVEI